VVKRNYDRSFRIPIHDPFHSNFFSNVGRHAEVKFPPYLKFPTNVPHYFKEKKGNTARMVIQTTTNKS
jgi:hypothetical protein